MSNSKTIISYIRARDGQANVLAIPRLYISLTGDPLAAMFLSQLIYWSDKGGLPGGWVVKTYAEWQEELEISKRQVSRIVPQLEKFGVETAVKKSRFHDQATVVHYRIDMERFVAALDEFFAKRDESSQWEVAKCDSQESQNATPRSDKSPLPLYTETTAETTANKKTESAENSAEGVPAFQIHYPRVPETYQQDPTADQEDDDSDEELPNLARLLNIKLGPKTCHPRRSKTRWNQLNKAKVVYSQVLGSGNIETYDFGSMFDHYDESQVFRDWVKEQLRYVLSKRAEKNEAGLQNMAIKCLLRLGDPKFGYWMFRRNYPGIAGQPCEQQFREEMDARYKPAPKRQPDDADRPVALQNLTPEEIWWLRMDALGTRTRERIIGGWEKLFDDKNVMEWNVSYPRDTVYAPSAELTEGEQLYVEFLRDAIRKAQGVWGHIVPDDYEKEMGAAATSARDTHPHVA